MSGSRAGPNAEELERIVADDRKEVMHKKMAAQAADLERSRAAKAAQQAAPPSPCCPRHRYPQHRGHLCRRVHRASAAVSAMPLQLPLPLPLPLPPTLLPLQPQRSNGRSKHSSTKDPIGAPPPATATLPVSIGASTDWHLGR